ncbi:MAG: helix-turn-helix domain-containing protein [Ruminococcus sp.]|nr:helix-turn-helix domain-containing protein [Ruminococcus sp.]
MFYGEKLKKLREEKNLKQSDLANLLNIDRTGYGQYEREDAIIPVKHMNTICNYFNISFDFILGLTDVLNYERYSKEIYKEESGHRLKEFRKENKLTQVKLAQILNTVHPVIANYENGKHLIATPFLYTICSKYHISADYLLGKIDSPKYLK